MNRCWCVEGTPERSYSSALTLPSLPFYAEVPVVESKGGIGFELKEGGCDEYGPGEF